MSRTDGAGSAIASKPGTKGWNGAYCFERQEPEMMHDGRLGNCQCRGQVAQCRDAPRKTARMRHIRLFANGEEHRKRYLGECMSE